jgi:hypothetical protein
LQHQIEFHIALPLIHRTDPLQSGVGYALLEQFKHFELSMAQEHFPNSKFQLLNEFFLSIQTVADKAEIMTLFGVYRAKGLLNDEEMKKLEFLVSNSN